MFTYFYAFSIFVKITHKIMPTTIAMIEIFSKYSDNSFSLQISKKIAAVKLTRYNYSVSRIAIK